MQAPTYIERSQALLLMREQEQMMHAAKMGKIATVSAAVGEAKTVTTMMKKNRQDRKKTKDFLTNEKNITINKDNQILLNKLVEISSGKWSSVAPVPKKASTRGKSVRVNGPTSLNMGVRKRETERIERENHAFAKRLFDKQAVLQKKALDSDWMSHQKYKKQIAKMPKGMKSMGEQQFQSQGGKFGYSASNMRSDPNLQDQDQYGPDDQMQQEQDEQQQMQQMEMEEEQQEIQAQQQEEEDGGQEAQEEEQQQQQEMSNEPVQEQQQEAVQTPAANEEPPAANEEPSAANDAPAEPETVEETKEADV